MQFFSYTHQGGDRIGASNGEIAADLTAQTGCENLGEALRKYGPQTLLQIAQQARFDLPLKDIWQYRPVIADPARILCVGLNYEEHRVEAGREKTSSPAVFLRLPSSQTGHLQPLIIPTEAPEGLDFEGEIAIVIGRSGRRISEAEAMSHVFGYAPYNDASVRSWQAHSTQWTSGKNFPATGAFGPTLVTADTLGDQPLQLTTRLNGTVVQSANTEMLTFSIPQLIAYISAFTELEPGDVIVTGTPGGVGFKRTPPLYMQDGDAVEVEVSGVGTLVNTVLREKR